MSYPQTKSVLLLLCDILQQEMELADNQVVLYNSKFNIPPETKLWISVRFLTGKAFGVATRYEAANDDAPLREVQSVNMGATITIDIFSRDTSALERKEEIIMALNSTYAQRRQELYAFKIGRLPSSFVDLSAVEGAAIPYRFSLSVQLQYKTEKAKSVDYYDDFTDSVTPEA